MLEVLHWLGNYIPSIGSRKRPKLGTGENMSESANSFKSVLRLEKSEMLWISP